MRYRITITLAFSLTTLFGCETDKKQGVAQTGAEDERSSKADSAKEAPPPDIHSNTHIAAGMMLEKQGDLKGAIAQYERAIAAEPRLATAYNRLGIIYQKLGRYADAENIFMQGASADPTSAALLNNLGYCYLARKRLTEAEQAFRDALIRSQDFQRARMNLAIVLAQSGRINESLIEFSKVVPADAAHFNVAMVCMQKRDYANAEKSLREALVINPECAGAQEQLQRMAQLATTASPKEPTGEVRPTGPLAGKSDDGSEATGP